MLQTRCLRSPEKERAKISVIWTCESLRRKLWESRVRENRLHGLMRGSGETDRDEILWH